MYVVKLKGKKISIDGQKVFFDYEEARQAVRRKMREMFPAGKVRLDTKKFGYWDGVSRQPNRFTGAGFSIVALRG